MIPWCALGAALVVAACGTQTADLPSEPVAAGDAIRVNATAVLEHPAGAPARPSRFRFAGGLELTSTDTSRFHGLSDLVVFEDDRFAAVTDEGDMVRGRLALDASGRLAGVSDVTLAPIRNIEGRPLSGAKADSDTEALAFFRNGDMLLGFERNHRVWLYPANGAAPRSAPSPQSPFPDNDGIEAVALAPEHGPDAYLVGREDTRDTWICRLSAGCVPHFRIDGDYPRGLVGARDLPGGQWAFLLRDFTPLVGNTITLLITDRDGRPIDRHDIRRPSTIDNFEGVAARPRPDGSVRFYILSDDNFSTGQRTLLMAWDWIPTQPATDAP
ncbi:MAG: esterase-like activity of phytase family protein [Phenylobacterium sp.]|nr:esterase-like activity of phytase family protein [Phenylobacterium sp.]